MEVILKHYGIAREDSYAFGDSMNDLAMIRYAGNSIIMENTRKAWNLTRPLSRRTWRTTGSHGHLKTSYHIKDEFCGSSAFEWDCRFAFSKAVETLRSKNYFSILEKCIIYLRKGSRRGKGRLRTRRKGDENNEHGTTLQKCSGRRNQRLREENDRLMDIVVQMKGTEPPGKSVYYRK